MAGPGWFMSVHHDWTVQVAGMAAAGVCGIRPATGPEIVRAGGLLQRAGCGDIAARQASGRTLLLLAWMDPDRLLGPGAGTGGLGEREPGAGTLRVVGCVEIDWSGPSAAGIGGAAADTVEVGRLYVEPALRGLGVGRALIAAAEAHCTAAGRSRLISDLAGTNASGAVTALAVGCGYTPIPPGDGSVEGEPGGGRSPQLSGSPQASGSPTGSGSPDHRGSSSDCGGPGSESAVQRPGWWWKDLERVPTRSAATAAGARGRPDPGRRRVATPPCPSPHGAPGSQPA